jgi:hypothetical protein
VRFFALVAGPGLDGTLNDGVRARRGGCGERGVGLGLAARAATDLSRRGRIALFDVEHEDGDVVLAARRQRGFDQKVTRGLGVGLILQDLFDLLVVDHVRQAVGAQQDPVARLDGLERQVVDLDVVLHAEDPGQDVLLRVVPGLVGAKATLFHHSFDERVVSGESLDGPVAKQIGA